MNPIYQVTDESGAVHVLLKMIGAGGQGEVWLTKGGRRIVKLITGKSDAAEIRRQLAFIRRLNLLDLHVAKPIAVLKPPHVGYVAEFLEDMLSVETLIKAPSDLIPWYIKTGSLRRRLRLLAHAGEALHGLHATGVIYGDISSKNVFVSEPIHANEAWLIDLDNVSYESNPKRTIYSCGYGAPEVVTNSAGNTSLSDAWSFAVLIWQTLTLNHPFIGDLVNNGDPELEEEAFAGRLPWVEHSSDDRNRCSTGLPPKHVLACKLMRLARKTFEEGINNRQKRTTVSEWAERLHLAADQTVACPNCTGTYFVIETSCPWCHNPSPSVLRINIMRWQSDKGLVKLCFGKLPLTTEKLILNRRVTEGNIGITGRTPQVELKRVDHGVSVRTHSGCTAWVAPVDKPEQKRQIAPDCENTIPLDGWMVFFDDPNKDQRVAVIGRSPT